MPFFFISAILSGWKKQSGFIGKIIPNPFYGFPVVDINVARLDAFRPCFFHASRLSNARNAYECGLDEVQNTDQSKGREKQKSGRKKCTNVSSETWIKLD